MDNLAHTLSGLLLRRSGLGRDTPWSGPVLAIAANLPDAEGAVVQWMDRPDYLIYHRGVTHSLAGAIPEALLFAAAVWGIGLWASRRWPDWLPRPPGFRALCLLTVAGVGVHLVLDWVNTYGVRFLLPFDDRWFYGDLAFIIDPWMWLLMGGGVALSGPLSRFDSFALLGAAALASIIAVSTAVGGIVPVAVPVVWFAGLAAIIVGAVVRRARAATPRIAHLFVAGFAIYLACMFVLGQTAKSRALEEHRGAAEIVSVNPRPGVPWDFQVTVWNRDTVHRYLTAAFGGPIEALPEIRTGLDDPAIEFIRESPAYRGWKSFARQPVARREGGYLVLGDARYRVGRRGDWTETRVRIPSGK